jgi:hypothetical protein
MFEQNPVDLLNDQAGSGPKATISASSFSMK